MTKFIVEVEMTESYEVEVEAETEEEAQQFATQTLAELDDPIGSEYHKNCTGFTATSVEQMD